EKLEATGKFYREMIAHVRKVLADPKRVVPEYDEQQGCELAGFVWFQGFNDLVSGATYPKRNEPGGYDLYSELLADLIRDVRKDLSAPKLPVVIGVIGVDGLGKAAKSPMLHLREAQAAPAALPEFQGTVSAVPTAGFWDDDLAELQERMQNLNGKLNQEFKKDPSLTGAAKAAARSQAVAEAFTPEEVKRLKAGVSNGGYHYLGAAKIIAPIGQALAEEMLKLQTTQAQK
ncbi:MAG TPA: sialate O-acetylesterase, partial [Pirellulales bacterium]